MVDAPQPAARVPAQRPLTDFDRSIIGGSIWLDIHLTADPRQLRQEGRRLREVVALIEEHVARSVWSGTTS